MQAVLFRDDTSFWFETLRVLGATAYVGADIGEVLVTAQAIKPGDYDSWYDLWHAAADRIAAEAEKAYAAGHLVSARDGLLQSRLLFDHLTCPKALLDFTEAEGAGAHCQAGAGRLAFARIYDWLDDTLAAR
jgi:hypothetical protein